MNASLLIATFQAEDSPAVCEAIRQEKVSWEDADFAVVQDGFGKRGFQIYGPAQQVMFVVGKLAGFGHDSLLGVRPMNARERARIGK